MAIYPVKFIFHRKGRKERTSEGKNDSKSCMFVQNYLNMKFCLFFDFNFACSVMVMFIVLI